MHSKSLVKIKEYTRPKSSYYYFLLVGWGGSQVLGNKLQASSCKLLKLRPRRSAKFSN